MTDTTILVKSNGWRIKIALGLGGLIVLVTIAFLYRFEAGIIALAIGGGCAVRVWVWALRHYKLSSFEQRRLEAEARKLEAEAVKARAESYFVETNTGVFVLDGIAISSFYPAVTASKTLADVPMLSEPEKRYRKFLDIEFLHLLVVGPSGSGKSTLMCHIIDNSGAACYVLDPHKKQNELHGLIWPANAMVIGDGRDWQEIDRKLVDILAENNSRYNLDYIPPKIYIVADEWLAVLRHCPHAEQFFEEIGSEARKVNIHLVIGTVSQTVDDLRVSAAIRDNFTQIKLNQTQNLGEITWSRGDKELVELPGRYRGRPVLVPSTTDEFAPPIPELDGGPVAWTPTATELRVYELHLQGTSLFAIHKEVYPDRSYGGNQASELKAVLAKFGVEL